MSDSDWQAPVSVRQAAAELGVSSQYLTKLCRQGRLKAKRLSFGWVIERAALYELAQTRALRRRLIAQERDTSTEVAALLDGTRKLLEQLVCAVQPANAYSRVVRTAEPWRELVFALLDRLSAPPEARIALLREHLAHYPHSRAVIEPLIELASRNSATAESFQWRLFQ